MTRPRPDPTSMSPAERLSELAAILARGLSRRSLRAQESQKELERQADHEAPCAPTVDDREGAA